MNILRKLIGLPPKYKLKTKSYYRFQKQQVIISTDEPSDNKILIVTKPHTNYFAHLLAYEFKKFNFESVISPFDVPTYDVKNKVIFCPQLHNDIENNYIGYQTEQTTNDRFFNEDHLSILKKSSVLIDYALSNIDFLKPQLPSTKFYHLPVSYCPHYIDFLIQNRLISKKDLHDERPYDVVFYGDPRNERRAAYLKELQKNFNVKIICGVFGIDVVRELLKAKIIVNIHYFDDAILEIGRIYESMSLGCHVVSEKAIDQNNHKRLNRYVDFCDIDNIPEMIRAVQYALDNPNYRRDIHEKATQSDLMETLSVNFKNFMNDIYQRDKKIMIKDNDTILITGGCGFIGANFIPYFLDKYPKYNIINIDLLTYAGDTKNLTEIENHPRYSFVKGDICNRSLIQDIFQKHDIRGVIHFAAESHVDNSITSPEMFLQTNIMGTYTLIDVARNHWMDSPFTYKNNYKNCRFHHISTDEVYGSLGVDGLFTEQTPYAPNSPYSASKASSDFIIRSYHHTYGMNVTTSNCSNNYGPKQHSEKLIPTIIRNALNETPIPIYGDGTNVRDWLYVMDHCTGIDLVYHRGISGETYNIGGKNELTNISLTNYICAYLDQVRPRKSGKTYKDLITFVKDRAGHDQRYAIDATKINTQLGWLPNENFASGIEKTINWYLSRDLF